MSSINETRRVGRQLRRQRLELGLTQAAVAARCGMSQSNISAYESGRRPLSPAQADRIRGVLRRRPSEILREHAAEVRRIAESHGATRVRVFGSIARGEDRYDSDVDLLVDFAFGADLFDMVLIRQEAESLLGVGVDVVAESGVKERFSIIRQEAVAV